MKIRLAALPMSLATLLLAGCASAPPTFTYRAPDSATQPPEAATGYARGTITPFGATHPWPIIADASLRGVTSWHGVSSPLRESGGSLSPWRASLVPRAST